MQVKKFCWICQRVEIKIQYETLSKISLVLIIAQVKSCFKICQSPAVEVQSNFSSFSAIVKSTQIISKSSSVYSAIEE